MKIIKEGTLLWWVGRQVECHKCKRVMEMESTDTITHEVTITNRPIHGVIVFECGLCGETLHVFKDKK